MPQKGSDEHSIRDDVWSEPFTQQLAAVLTEITEAGEMQRFLRDVMTTREIVEISSRLETARMLDSGATYTSITETTHLSSRTIARISDWLGNGLNGYGVALSILDRKLK